MKQPAVYIVGSENLCIYIGVTSNLPKRVYEHKTKLVNGFSKKYNCTKLLYYEVGGDMLGMIEREKQLKGWNRKRKLSLIRTVNPEYKDLFEEISG